MQLTVKESKDAAGLVKIEKENWLNSFFNLFSLEINHWWSSYYWIIQIIAWSVFINGLYVLILLSGQDPSMGGDLVTVFSDELAKLTPDVTKHSILITGIQLFYSMANLVLSLGIIILMQNSVISEKELGTMSWMLSNPVSRKKVILSKFLGNVIHLLLFALVIPAAVFYALIALTTGVFLPLLPFMIGCSFLAVTLVYYTSLLLFLGVVFNSRGPVMMISLFIAFSSALANFLPAVVPLLINLTPMTMGSAGFISLFTENLVPLLIPAGGVFLTSLIFLAVAFFEFERKEF